MSDMPTPNSGGRTLDVEATTCLAGLVSLRHSSLSSSSSSNPPNPKEKEEETRERFDSMAMGPPRLLRGLIPQLLPVDAWLPCSSRLQLLLSHFHCRLHLHLRWPSCADAFKLLLALLLVSAALAEVRYIASSSMAPTLRPADRAVAERITYFFRRPSIGDIVFFKVPTTLQNYGVNKDVVFIKRILATPGDFIEVRQGQLIINGVARKEHYTASHASYTMEAMRLPEGHVFVMGDNRNNSCDSRAWGPLPISNIIGRYMMSFTRSSIQ
uniref:signal peptidase I n=1 Tax=Oryza punctata TaxID=4537 RepID=A0A0E0KXA7_ORYPU